MIPWLLQKDCNKICPLDLVKPSHLDCLLLHVSDVLFHKLKLEMDALAEEKDDTIPAEDLVIPDMGHLGFDEDLDLSDLNREDAEEEEEQERKKKQEKKPNTRVPWTPSEMEEVRKYFEEFLRTNCCPSKTDVERAKEKSKRNGGVLWKRYWHTIVKKVSYINGKEGANKRDLKGKGGTKKR